VEKVCFEPGVEERGVMYSIVKEVMMMMMNWCKMTWQWQRVIDVYGTKIF